MLMMGSRHAIKHIRGLIAQSNWFHDACKQITDSIQPVLSWYPSCFFIMRWIFSMEEWIVEYDQHWYPSYWNNPCLSSWYSQLYNVFVVPVGHSMAGHGAAKRLSHNDRSLRRAGSRFTRSGRSGFSKFSKQHAPVVVLEKSGYMCWIWLVIWIMMDKSTIHHAISGYIYYFYVHVQ